MNRTQTESRLPDFFIVGAPKCGTTALYTYLRQHPDVYMPDEKEIYYFCDDLFSRKPVRTEQEYISLFAPGAGAKRVGEATPWYLYSQSAARRIREFSPAARIVISVRHPVDMMYSLHSEKVYRGQEPIEDFARAIQREREGSRPPIPPELDPPRGVETYRAAARFAPHVRRYQETFGRQAVHVVVFDDIVSGSTEWFDQLLEFLDVSLVPLPVGEQVNPNKVLRSATLTRLLRSPPPRIMQLAKSVLPTSGRRLLIGALWKFNTVRRPRREIDPDLRLQLTEELSDDIRELATLIGRDLTHWISAAAPHSI